MNLQETPQFQHFQHFLDGILKEQDVVQTKMITKPKINKRELGRWTIYESQSYLEVLKWFDNTRQIIKELKVAMPNRVQSQIRAHHQKMLKKYGTIKDIISVLDRWENKYLLNIDQRLGLEIQNLEKKSMNFGEKKMEDRR